MQWVRFPGPLNDVWLFSRQVGTEERAGIACARRTPNECRRVRAVGITTQKREIMTWN